METAPIDPVGSIADAVMQEGLLLYPYRPSALKNQQRWNFGVLMPPNFCAAANNGDRADMRVECVAEHEPDARLTVRLRFLQLGANGQAEERNVIAPTADVESLMREPYRRDFTSGGVRGTIQMAATPIDERVSKLSIEIANVTPFSGASRDDALGSALLSCHAVLALEQGAFVSLLEGPPELLARAACRNVGVWPVLVGAEGSRDRMLASPIILYDYPRIAPQSPAAMFDGTEIDELLSLRIQTLTPDEKAELRRHPRTAALLERVESLGNDELAALHGTWRSPSPAPPVPKPGDSVVLRPKRRADILDLALVGRRATVSSIERDFENRVYVCVTVDDDPGRDLGLEGKPGHRFFFDLDEVELS